MSSTQKQRTVIDIKATAEKNLDIVPYLLSAHAISGRDTVASFYQVGKSKVLKILKSGCTLKYLGDEAAEIAQVIAEATHFIGLCYGVKNATSMSNVRIEVWKKKISGRNICTMPKLRTLPPTTEAFEENVKRAHHQACILKQACKSQPPNTDPTNFGWTKELTSKSLTATPLPPGTLFVPEVLMKMIKCNCSAEKICVGRCGCSSAHFSCTAFCNCNASVTCGNIFTIKNEEVSDDDTDNEEQD